MCKEKGSTEIVSIMGQSAKFFMKGFCGLPRGLSQTSLSHDLVNQDPKGMSYKKTP